MSGTDSGPGDDAAGGTAESWQVMDIVKWVTIYRAWAN